MTRTPPDHPGLLAVGLRLVGTSALPFLQGGVKAGSRGPFAWWRCPACSWPPPLPPVPRPGAHLPTPTFALWRASSCGPVPADLPHHLLFPTSSSTSFCTRSFLQKPPCSGRDTGTVKRRWTTSPKQTLSPTAVHTCGRRSDEENIQCERTNSSTLDICRTDADFLPAHGGRRYLTSGDARHITRATAKPVQRSIATRAAGHRSGPSSWQHHPYGFPLTWHARRVAPAQPVSHGDGLLAENGRRWRQFFAITGTTLCYKPSYR